MEQIEKYLAEIEAAMYKMSPTEREHLMEVLHLALQTILIITIENPRKEYVCLL